MVTVFLRRMTWTGVRHGMNGSRVWMIVAILAVGARTIRRIARSQPEVLYRTKVMPGDVIVIGSKTPD
jgi:hypothetical protein